MMFALMGPALALALMPSSARADPPAWDAHAAAALLDASFESSEACEAQLAQARAAESTPAADIDPRLRDLFAHASCTPVDDGYAMRLSWPQLAPQSEPQPDVETAG